MPRYRITLSDGRIVTVEAAAPPSESDVLAAIEAPVNVGQDASFSVNGKPASPEDFIDRPARPEDPGVLSGAWNEIGAPLANLPKALATQAQEGVQTLGTGLKEQLMRSVGSQAPRTVGGGDVADALGGLLGGPVYLMGKGATTGILDQAKRAVDEFRSGRWTEGTGRALAAVLPVLGPDAASIAEDLQTRPKYAIGRLTALLGTLGIPSAIQAGKAGQAGRGAAAQSQATKLVTQALDPRKERFKAVTQRIAPEVARRKIGGTLEQVASKADEGAESAGRAIEDFWSDPAVSETPIKTGSLVGELERSKEPFRNIVRDPLTNKPINMVDIDPRVIDRLTELQKVIEAHGDTISAGNARRMLQNWSESVAQQGGYAHRTPGSSFVTDLAAQTELWAKREGASAIRQVLAETHPDIQALNKEYSFQRNLRDVAESTLARTSSHRSRGLSTRVAQTGGAAAGALAGSSLGPIGTGIGAVVGGEVAARLAQVFDGPRWKLMQASKKQALADALASGNESRIKTAVGRILADERLAGRGAIAAGKASVPRPAVGLVADKDRARREP